MPIANIFAILSILYNPTRISLPHLSHCVVCAGAATRELQVSLQPSQLLRAKMRVIINHLIKQDYLIKVMVQVVCALVLLVTRERREIPAKFC